MTTKLASPPPRRHRPIHRRPTMWLLGIVLLVFAGMLVVGVLSQPVGSEDHPAQLAAEITPPDVDPAAAAARWDDAIQYLQDVRFVPAPVTDPATGQVISTLAEPMTLLLGTPDPLPTWQQRFFTDGSPAGRAAEIASAQSRLAALTAPGPGVGAPSLLDRGVTFSHPPFPSPDAEQLAAMGVGGAATFAITLPPYAAIRQAARASQVHGLLALDAGRPDEAARAVAAIDGMANIAAASPWLIGALVAWAVQSVGDTLVEDALLSGRLDAESTAAIRATLERRPDHLERSLRGEAFTFHGCLDGMFTADGRFLPGHARALAATAGVGVAVTAPPGNSIRISERLMNAFGLIMPRRDGVEALIDGAHSSDRDAVRAAGRRIDEAMSAPALVKVLDMPRTVAVMFIPAMERFLDQASRIRTRRAMLLAGLAVRAHELEHGTLPQDLAATGLPESARIDPVDGSPLAYRILTADERAALAAAGPPGVPAPRWLIDTGRDPGNGDPIESIPRSPRPVP